MLSPSNTQEDSFPFPLFRYWVEETPTHKGFFITNAYSRFTFYKTRVTIQGIGSVDPKKVQHSTGQFDRLKNLLWEGDIVFFSYEQIYLAQILRYPKLSLFYTAYIPSLTPMPKMINYLHHCERIGHIYQYPELHKANEEAR
jgi:hypothetical protein